MFLLLVVGVFFCSISNGQISLVKDLNPGPGSSIDYSYASYPKLNDFVVTKSGRLFFACSSASSGFELCASDGTPAGTQVIKDINPGSASAFKSLNEDRRIAPIGDNKVVFKAFVGSKDALFISDGCAINTMLLSNVNSVYSPGIRQLHNFEDMPDSVFFFASGSGFSDDELWWTSGTPETTAKAVDACTANSCPGAHKSDSIGYFGGKVYFSAANVAPTGFDQPQQLWRFDPATGTGSEFAVINNGGSAEITGFAGTSTGLFFLAQDGTAQLNRLFVLTSDAGPPRGLDTAVDYIVKPLVAGPQNRVFFQADSNGSGNELHAADTTRAFLVANIIPGSVHGWAEEITAFPDFVMFVGDKELYKSDGTAQGTVLVKDLGGVGSTASYPRHLTKVQNKLYFSGEELDTGRELWESDGTTENTKLVQDLCPGSCSSSPAHLTDVNGVLFFSASLPATGRELYRLGATSQATAAALSCVATPFTAAPTPMAPMVSVAPNSPTASSPTGAPATGGDGGVTSSATVTCSAELLQACTQVCSTAGGYSKCECSQIGISNIECRTNTVAIPPGGVTGQLPDGTPVVLQPSGDVTISGQPATTTSSDPVTGTVTATSADGRVVVITPATGQVTEGAPPPNTSCTGSQLNQCILACGSSAMLQFCDCSSGSPRHFCQASGSPTGPPTTSSADGPSSPEACSTASTQLCAAGCPRGVQECVCSQADGTVKSLVCAEVTVDSSSASPPSCNAWSIGLLIASYYLI